MKIKTTIESFVDAQKMHVKYPKTFDVPSKKELSKLKPGSIVKVATPHERFWTVIKKINGNTIIAKVDNALVFSHTHGLNLGDLISFTSENIYSVYCK